MTANRRYIPFGLSEPKTGGTALRQRYWEIFCKYGCRFHHVVEFMRFLEMEEIVGRIIKKWRDPQWESWKCLHLGAKSRTS